MRKERLIVPVVLGLALVWAVAQYAASLLFERELARTLAESLFDSVAYGDRHARQQAQRQHQFQG